MRIGSFTLYAVTNAANGKQYIGKTSLPLWKRWSDHKSAARNNGNTYLYRAIRKYGERAFQCRQIDSASTEERANAFEKYYIQLFDTHIRDKGYNLTMGGDGVIPNEETREKFRAYRTSDETKELLRAAAKKQWSDPEYREKHRLGMEKAVAHPEYKEKAGRAWRGKLGERHPRFGKKHPLGAVHILTQASKRRWDDPEKREAMIAAQTEGKKNSSHPHFVAFGKAVSNLSSIKEKRESGYTVSSLAKEYNVSRKTIRKVLAGVYGA